MRIYANTRSEIEGSSRSAPVEGINAWASGCAMPRIPQSSDGLIPILEMREQFVRLIGVLQALKRYIY